MLFQVHQTYDLIDELTSDFTQKVNGSHDEDKNSFQQRFEALCDKTLHAARQCHDTNKSAVIQRHLQDMTRIKAELLSLVTNCKFILLSLVAHYKFVLLSLVTH